MFIDSIVTACAGADPMKPEAVCNYTAALEYIGLPVLSLAHTDKAENLRYPFGSIFWHNLARMTYSLKADGATVILQHRKHNNYEREPTRKVEVAWNDDGLPINVDETLYAEDLARRISSALIGRTLTVREVCDRLDEDADEDADPDQGRLGPQGPQARSDEQPATVQAGRQDVVERMSNAYVNAVRLAVRLRQYASVYTLSGYVSCACPIRAQCCPVICPVTVRLRTTAKPDRGTRLYRRSRPCPVARGMS